MYNIILYNNIQTNHAVPPFHTGQFWNVPLGVSDLGDSSFVMEVNEKQSNNYRRFKVRPYSLTWDHSEIECYYAGNAQGGSETDSDPKKSIIEGTYIQYQTSSLFATDFDYKQFNDDNC